MILTRVSLYKGNTLEPHVSFVSKLVEVFAGFAGYNSKNLQALIDISVEVFANCVRYNLWQEPESTGALRCSPASRATTSA